MDGKFTFKYRFVVGGHKTDPPVSLTYSSVVSIVSVLVAFTISDLNDIYIWACYIGNTYLNIKYREKICMKSGTKFGDDKVKVVIVIRALYVLK